MVPRASSSVTRVSCLPLFATKERKRKLNQWYKQLFGLTRANKDKILQDNMNAENWLVEGKNAIVHFKVKALNSYYWTLTTSKKNKGWSKLGFFCVFLMTVEWTTCPPHSNSILGDATLASWYLFMLRTPQHNTCGRKHHSKTLFTWSGGPRSSGVGFFCFVSPRAWKQKKPTPLDRGLPLYVNRP